MKPIWLAFVATCVLAACDAGRPVHTGFNPADYHSRWLVVNYWAEWCKPCIKEIPELNALDKTYSQVAVVGVNFDGVVGEQLRQQIDRLGIAFPVVEDEPSAALGVSLPTVLPATFIFDPDGQLAHTLVGPQTLETLAAATGQVSMPVEEEEDDELLPQ